jgi:hypothetical protein
MKQITIKNKTYKSLTAAAKAYDLTIGMVSNRLKAKHSIEEAFNIVPYKRKKNKKQDTSNPKLYNRHITVINGIEYSSITKVSKAFKINRTTLSNRLCRGLTIEEAISLGKAPRNKPIIIESKRFPSLSKAAQYYKINYPVVCSRLSKEWSIEEAFGLKERGDQKGKKILIAGKIYPSVTSAARTFKIDRNKAVARLRHKWAPEEAFGLRAHRDRRRKKDSH